MPVLTRYTLSHNRRRLAAPPRTRGGRPPSRVSDAGLPSRRDSRHGRGSRDDRDGHDGLDSRHRPTRTTARATPAGRRNTARRNTPAPRTRKGHLHSPGSPGHTRRIHPAPTLPPADTPGVSLRPSNACSWPSTLKKFSYILIRPCPIFSSSANSHLVTTPPWSPGRAVTARRKVFSRCCGCMLAPAWLSWFLTLNPPEKIVNIQFAALAMAFLVTSGCALSVPNHSAGAPTGSLPAANTTAMGSSSAGTQQASAGRSTGRTREEVHAEALEAVTHYKSTQSEERDYFNPYAH